MKSIIWSLITILAAGGPSFVWFSHGLNNTRNANVTAVIDTFWQWRLRESPEYGTKYKLYTNEDQLEEYTEEAMARKVSEARAILVDVEDVDTNMLDAQDKISIDILKTLLEAYISGYEYRVYGAYNPVSALANPLREFSTIMGRMTFQTVQDYNNWIKRLQLLPRSLSDMIKLMKIAITEGKTLNNHSMTNVLNSFDSYMSEDVTDMPYYHPFKNISRDIAEAERNDLVQRAQSVLQDNVVPAIQTMRDFMADEYIPNTRPGIGVSSLPGGAEYYQACLDWHLGAQMTPDEIHYFGLRIVEMIKSQMEKIMKNAGFEGTIQEYITFLKSDPENFYQTEEEMTEGYKALVEYIKGKMPLAFETITKVNIRVQGSSSRYGGTGFYRDPSSDGKTPGVFIANVYDAPKKPKFNMLALTLHESFPGHHQQAGRAIELGLPDFRRLIEFRKYYAVPFNWKFFTAYIEGWGLYAEKLGEAEDLNVYQDDNSMLGRYNSEIFRACRLVIDTGIHAFGWSRQQAVDYLAEYTSLADSTIQSQIDRYITIPGHATAYKIGEMKFIELRRRAETELGECFDIKKFHTQVLDVGPVPLNILETVVSKWIDEELAQCHITNGTSDLTRISYMALAIAMIMITLLSKSHV